MSFDGRPLLAAVIGGGLLARSKTQDSPLPDPEYLAKRSIEYADAILAACEQPSADVCNPGQVDLSEPAVPPDEDLRAGLRILDDALAGDPSPEDLQARLREVAGKVPPGVPDARD